MTERAGCFWVALSLILSGCSSERVVLLPSADGRPSAVLVRNEYGEQLLDKPFAALAQGRAGNRLVYVSSQEDMQRRFGPAMAAQPARPKSWTLYFENGSDRLTSESEADLALICQDLGNRPSPEITLVGHTDRVGSEHYNDRLSERRAQKVLGRLLHAGVAPEKTELLWRGEHELKVETPDGVEEAQNRRVEITVR